MRISLYIKQKKFDQVIGHGESCDKVARKLLWLALIEAWVIPQLIRIIRITVTQNTFQVKVGANILGKLWLQEVHYNDFQCPQNCLKCLYISVGG